MDIQKLRDLTRHDDKSPRVAELAALFVERSIKLDPTGFDIATPIAGFATSPVRLDWLAPHVAARIAEKLVNIGQSLHVLAEYDCNYGLTPSQEKRRDKLKAEAVEIGEALGFKVETHGDPRGCVVKLIDPLDERAGDGFGGGWGVYR